MNAFFVLESCFETLPSLTNDSNACGTLSLHSSASCETYSINSSVVPEEFFSKYVKISFLDLIKSTDSIYNASLLTENYLTY